MPRIVSFAVLFGSAVLAFQTPALAQSGPVIETGSYVSPEVGKVVFFLPAYEDVFLVNAANALPVTGQPLLSEGDNEIGERVSLSAGTVTGWQTGIMKGQITLDVTGIYDRAKEDSAHGFFGPNIRIGTLNAANGISTGATGAFPNNQTLELSYKSLELIAMVGHLTNHFGDWLVKPSFGAHVQVLEQEYDLRLANTLNANRYSRSEKLETDYFGPRFGLNISGPITDRIQLNAGGAVSVMWMRSDYQGSDFNNTGAGATSFVEREFETVSVNPEVELGLNYELSTGFTIGIETAARMIGKAPYIVHAQGSGFFGNAIPLRLEDEEAYQVSAGLRLTAKF